MTASRILVVEDESELARTLAQNLEMEGYRAEIALTGERALELMEAKRFHLVILDLLLPGINGYDVCQTLREQGSRVPIIMLTALDQTHQKIRGLEIGADDYLPKPFNLGELMARVKALLRRASGDGFDEPVLRIGKVEVDFNQYEIRRGRKRDRLAHLLLKRFELLGRRCSGQG